MSDGFFDREYDPKRTIPDFASYFARWKKEALRARREATVEADIEYGPSAEETLDFFPAGSSRTPLLIFLHGGYWRAFHKDDFSWVAPAYVAAGISVAVVNYALAPAVSLFEITSQIRRSIAWLVSNSASLAVDPRRIVCSGHSAGGHLAAMALTTDWSEFGLAAGARPLSGAIAISGLFDLVPVSQADFLKSDLGLDAIACERLSPINLRPTMTAPVLTVVGELESNEFHRQSELLVRHWGNSAVAGPMIVEAANHFDVCDRFADKDSQLFRTTTKYCEGNVATDLE